MKLTRLQGTHILLNALAAALFAAVAGAYLEQRQFLMAVLFAVGATFMAFYAAIWVRFHREDNELDAELFDGGDD